MENMNDKKEQQKAFKDILSHYDAAAQTLYFDILKMYSDRGAQMPKSIVKNEILDKVKEVVK